MTDTLESFGKNFQEVLVQALLQDHVWASQMQEVFKEEYLEPKYLNYLASKFFQYYASYKVFPTLPMLVTVVKNELKQGTDRLILSQIVDFLTKIRTNPNLNDVPYVKDKSLDFCRKQALKSAIEEAIDLMANEKYELIAEKIKKAVVVGTTPSTGHDYYEDIEARFQLVSRNPIATGMTQLDDKMILNGGLGKGELGVVVGSTGAGKSHMLIQLGAEALKRGKNVLHYTLELSETQIGIRYDSNLCEINASDVIEKKEEVINKHKELRNSCGRLIIKHYPSNSPTVYTFRSHIERCMLKGFKPDLLVIDYADVVRSTRQYDSLRHELKLVYEELRAYADELGIPIWTASQSNKEGANSDVIDLTNMSEAYGKAMVADVVLSLSRKSIEKASGLCRLYVAKNRAGRDGLLYNAKIDTAQSRLTIQSVQSLESVEKFNEDDMKRRIREKLKNVEDSVNELNDDK